MAAADEEDSTNWTPLSRAASTDEGRRQLVDDLANGRYPVRYVDEMCAISQSSGEAGRIEILEWRVGRLPEHFVRLGEFDWKWSYLTHAGRTLQRIEIQFPAEEAASEPPPPAADQEAPPVRPTKGRPSSKLPIEAEGERLMRSGVDYPTFESLVEAVGRLVKEKRSTKPGTIRAHLRPIFKQWKGTPK
jgi:hypothetical protein